MVGRLSVAMKSLHFHLDITMIIGAANGFVYFHIDISDIIDYNTGEIGDITLEMEVRYNMSPIMTIRAPEELREALRQISRELGYTTNALVLSILWDWVKANKEGRE